MADHRDDETRAELQERVRRTFAERSLRQTDTDGDNFGDPDSGGGDTASGGRRSRARRADTAANGQEGMGEEAGGSSGNGREKKRHLSDRILRGVLTALVLVAAVFVGNMLYVSKMDGRFYHFSSVNHFDVSGQTVEEASAQLSDICDTTFVNFYEGTDMELSLSLADLGYSLDMADLQKEMRSMVSSQRKLFPLHLLGSKDYTLEAALVLDEQKLSEMVSEDNLLTPRVKTEDAYIVTDEEDAYIVPEVYGTEFDSSQLRTMVKDTVAESALSSQGGVISVEITEDMYKKPVITKDDPDLVAKEAAFSKYVDSKIIYEFGSKTEEIGWDTIRTWIRSDEEGTRLDEETMYNFIYDLASRYNTVYEERTFHTSYGYSIQIPRNEYGYRIDYDGEYFQLLEDLETGGEVRREPVYSISGYSRDGRDDLNGYYIEVDLTAQHLWMYYEGGLVVETDVVTGLPTQERETVDGAFAIPYKQSPANLVGQGGSGQQTWDVDVDYWMPFCDGQGLHDAKWRGSFGGTIYKTYGSHGCVNLPTYAAAMIYSYCGTNYPIILYKS